MVLLKVMDLSILSNIENRKHIAPVHTVAWALCPAPKDPDVDPGLEPQFRVSAVTVVWPCCGGHFSLSLGRTWETA